LEFIPAKLGYYATNALADLGLHHDAIAQGERSVRLYEVTPTHIRSYGDEAGCHLALAEIALRRGAVDEAGSRIEPVLSLASQSRHFRLLSEMLGGLRLKLADPALRGAEAHSLTERIESL
jgi:ATP/maltotriose-dependent transcriptional regulator MalT